MATFGELTITIKSTIWDNLLQEIGITKQEAFKGVYCETEEDGPTGLILEDPVDSICRMLLGYGVLNMLPESAYEKSVDYEEEYRQAVWRCHTLEDLIRQAHRTLEFFRPLKLKDASDQARLERCRKILELGTRLYEMREAFVSEAYVYLGAGHSCWYRGYGPCFAYRRLELDRGEGTLIDYSAYQCLQSAGGKGPFYQWALEHGYYKGNPGKKHFEDGYEKWFAYNPPFEEYAQSGPDVKTIMIHRQA